MSDCDCVPGHRCDCWDYRADPERRAEPDWALLDGTLRQRLEYARDQHTLGAQWLDAGYALVPKPASWHRACADWYQQMLDQLDSIETHPERRAEGLDSLTRFEMAEWPGQDFLLYEDVAALRAALTPPPAGKAVLGTTNELEEEK